MSRPATLKTRLLTSFGLVAALLVLIAFFGILELRALYQQAEFLTDNVLPGVNHSRDARVALLELRRGTLNHALSGEASKAHEDTRIAQAQQHFREAIDTYEKTIFQEEERPIVARVRAGFARLEQLTPPVLAASRAGDLAEVEALLAGEHKTVRDALGEDLDLLVDINNKAAVDASAEIDSAYDIAWWTLVIISAAGLVIAIVLSLRLVRVVTRQLGGDPADAAAAVRSIAAGDLDAEMRYDRNHPSLLRDMGELRDRLRQFYGAQMTMQKEHDAGDIDHRLPADQFPGAYSRMAQAVNDLIASHIEANLQSVSIMNQYGVGDLSKDFPRMPGKKAILTEAMDKIKANLGSMNGEIQRLVRAAAEGDFTVRGNADAYQYSFREMVAGLNVLMETADTGLRDVGRVLQALADGDLTQRVGSGYRGAFGELANNTNRSIESVRGIVQRISAAVETINIAAGEIASGNADLSTRTESQAASLEETASSMEELTATVRANAENTRTAEQVVHQATDGARRGGEVVAAVVDTMQRITQASGRIGDIIGVIDGIAFQTNILALNAAVEAARAGDQGRGFAVVASEVRSLAQRSAEAAKEIKGLIDTSTRTVDEGAKLVDQAGEEIRALVDSVSRVTNIMREISAATDEQRSGIELVNETVMQLDQATQQNAALVEEATAAARSLEDQAQGLSQAVGAFRVEGNGGNGLALPASPAASATPRKAAAPAAKATPAPAMPKRANRAPVREPLATEGGDWDEF